jgi:hypothetical protein
MQVSVFYKDNIEYVEIMKKIDQAELHDDITHYKNSKKILVDVSPGLEGEAENFFIALRYRGRKVLIDA